MLVPCSEPRAGPQVTYGADSVCVCFKRIIITIHNYYKLEKCLSPLILTFAVYEMGF